MQRRLRFQIPPDRAGVALADFLAQRFPYHARDGWLGEISAGRVRVNGAAAEAGRPLAAGDTLEYDGKGLPEPRVNLEASVLFDDEDLLVVDKPPNLPCHPGGRYFNHTLWAVLKTRCRVAEPAFVNRLDRETSGLVVVARHALAAKRCRAQFATRRVAKRYLALIEGTFPEALDAVGWLTPDAASPVSKKRAFALAREGASAPPDGESAETRFRLAARHGPISEVEVLPRTGRLHQIRATLQSLGFPVVGDKLYGPDPAIFLRFCRDEMTDDDRRRLRVGRQALHAAGLRFRHPRTGKTLVFDLPLPPDLREVTARTEDGDSRI